MRLAAQPRQETGLARFRGFGVIRNIRVLPISGLPTLTLLFAATLPSVPLVFLVFIVFPLDQIIIEGGKSLLGL